MYFLKLQAVNLILQNIGEVSYFTVKFLQYDEFFCLGVTGKKIKGVISVCTLRVQKELP